MSGPGWLLWYSDTEMRMTMTIRMAMSIIPLMATVMMMMVTRFTKEGRVPEANTVGTHLYNYK